MRVVKHGRLCFAWVLTLLLCGMMPGCAAPRMQAQLPPVADADSEEMIAAAELLRERHNQRVEPLQTLSAAGVIEITWFDENGKQFAQGDADFWFQRPLQTALRVEKLGDVLLWLGSDGQRYWLFDMLHDRTVLTIGRPGETIRMADGSAVGLDPAALLDLMGLSVLPESSVVYHGDAPAQVERTVVGFDVHERGSRGSRGSTRRVYLDAISAEPLRVELFDERGELVAYSRLQRYHTVAIPGRAALNSPRIATLIDLYETQREGSVKLALGAERLAGDPDAGPFDRVFSLERLQQAMPPDVVNDLTVP